MAEIIKDGVLVEGDATSVFDPTAEDITELTPEGWNGDGDFFDDATWGSGETNEEANEATIPTSDEAPAESTDVAVEESTSTRKLKFKAQVDHNDVDVELDEADLPTLYQKAQNLERTQMRAKENGALARSANILAKGMGYESADAMLRAAADNYRKSEIDRLVNDRAHPVHPDVAADIIDRRLNFANMFSDIEDVTPPASAAAPEAKPSSVVQQDGRDFNAEVRELLVEHPQLLGKTLPDEVMTAAALGKNLVEAYHDYEKKRIDADNAQLRKENKTLKQNADSASRAPVKGVTGTGATNTSPDDPFLVGFDSI